MKSCGIEGCGRGARKRGLCSTHYKRERRGTPGGVIETHARPRLGDKCDHQGCDRPLMAKGFCSLHYKYRRAERGPRCSIEGCEGKVIARGYCGGHYSRLMKGQDLERPFNKYVVKTGCCKVPACSKPDDHRNYCIGHYRTVMKYHLTDEMALKLFAELVCPICLKDDQPLVVDHDHSCCPTKSTSCGKCIRGMICAVCNTGLGFFREDHDSLKRASDYLNNNLVIE